MTEFLDDVGCATTGDSGVGFISDDIGEISDFAIAFHQINRSFAGFWCFSDFISSVDLTFVSTLLSDVNG